MTNKLLLPSPFNNEPVHIIGLGWLGLPLSKELVKKGMKVSGTVTSQDKQKRLLCEGIDVDIFDLYTSFLDQYTDFKVSAKQRFKNAKLVLNIPPGRQYFTLDKYLSSMINLIDIAMEAGLTKLIFISTTSVYGKQTGTIINTSELMPSTESGIAHARIERYLLLNYPTRFKILRPAGLIGPNEDGSLRHPIFTLCNKTNISKGYDPVNLVHQADLIQAISALIMKETTHSVYNIAALEHPSRKDYYTWCAQQLQLKLPEFIKDTRTRQLSKRIDATDTFTELDITAKYASPFAMLEI